MPFQPLGYKKGKQTNENNSKLKTKLQLNTAQLFQVEPILLIKVTD